eukprot:15471807-Alexandrium_andersonii.AAC.1
MRRWLRREGLVVAELGCDGQRQGTSTHPAPSAQTTPNLVAASTGPALECKPLVVPGPQVDST